MGSGRYITRLADSEIIDLIINYITVNITVLF